MEARYRQQLFALSLGVGLGYFGNILYVPSFVATLGSEYSGSWAGFIIFLTYFGRLFSTFLYQGTMQRIGTKLTITAGLLLEALSLLCMAFSSHLWQYCLFSLCIGMGSGLSFPGLKNILSAFPESIRAKSFSIFQMASQLGFLAGAIIGGLVAIKSTQLMFIIVFFVFLTYCIVIRIWIPQDEPLPPGATTQRSPILDFSLLGNLSFKGGTSYFLLSSLFWLLYSHFIVGIALHISAYIPGQSPSSPFWVTAVTMLSLQLPVFRFVSQKFSPALVMALGFAAMTLSFVVLGFGFAPLWVYLASFFIVFGEILFIPSFDMWVASRMDRVQLPRAMGAMHFFRSGGNMLGTFSAGFLFDASKHIGIPGSNWLFVGALALVGSLFCAMNQGAPAPVTES